MHPGGALGRSGLGLFLSGWQARRQRVVGHAREDLGRCDCSRGVQLLTSAPVSRSQILSFDPLPVRSERNRRHFLALFELSFVSSLKTFRRRWTVNLYWRSCFKTNNDETGFSGTELDFLRVPLKRGGLHVVKSGLGVVFRCFGAFY